MRKWLKCVGTAQGRSEWESSLEGLEPRTLLTDVPSLVSSERVTWAGFPMDVRPGSFVMTFHTAAGREAATANAHMVAASMGLQVQSIDVTARGRFANVRTSSQVTEAAAEGAKARFGFLRQFEPDRLAQLDLIPNDARYPEQWALNNTGQAQFDSGTGILTPGVPGADMDAERAWNITTGSDRVVIAVIDSGVDIRHRDLAANIWSNSGEIPNNNLDDDGNGFIDDVNGWDFVGDGQAADNDPADPVDPGHGTAVAGTIGAVGGNGIGIAGTAWNVSMMPLKIGGDGPGGLPLFAILGALEYVTMMKTEFGVNIVATNNSYGALLPGDFVEFDSAQAVAIEESTNAGVLFVASAGNDAVDNDSNQAAFPASYPNPDIISVAASNNRDQLASFSNYGATAVDVAAPGEQVLTTEVGGGYQLINGTSFSGPYTAGVVAMIASVNRFLPPQQIKAALLDGVDRLPQLQGRVLTGGRVNLYRSMLNAQFPGPIVTAVTPGSQTAPVSQISVSFSKDIDPSFFSTSGIELRRANQDARFDGNDVFIDVTDPNVATVRLLDANGVSVTTSGLPARTLVIDLAAPLARDLHRLRLIAPSFRDTDGRYLNGDVGTGNDELYDFNVVAFRGPLEPNDAISQASPVILNAQGSVELTDLVIGDGIYDIRDVDMFRVFANGPALITAEVTARGLVVPSELDSYLRLFDASGFELVANDNFSGLDSKVQFFVPAAGQYYIGVSGFPNAGYNPILENSGIGSTAIGVYTLNLQVQTAASDTSTRTNTNTVNIPATGSILSTINVTDGRSVLDVNVRVSLTHTFVGDLQATLTGPGGQVVTLINRRGGSGDNLTLTVFDDEAPGSIVAGAPPFTGSFRPETPLSIFDQSNAAGVWTLTINDLKAADSGQLTGWALELTLANDIFGPFEVNDTNIVATDVNIPGVGSRTFNAFIGDGAFGLRDVDLFLFNAGTGTTISALATPTSGTLDTILRLFDVNGNEIALDKRRGSTASALTYVVANAGVYYVGVSGGNTTSPTDFGNDSYILSSGGSGSPTDATGTYRLVLTVAGGISEGGKVLDGGGLTVGVGANGAIGLDTGLDTGEEPVGIALNGMEFLRRGGIDSYFGVSLDGFSILNTADGTQSDLSVAVAAESDHANRRVVTTGTYRNLSVRRVLAFASGGRHLAVDVTLSNRSLSPMNSIAWMEGMNADQGFTGLPVTRNTVNNIRNSAPRLATAIGPSGLTIGLGAPTGGIAAVTSFEPRGTVRDAFQIINSPIDPDPAGDAGVSNDDDMTLAFNVGSLGPNQSATFRYFIFVGTALNQVLGEYAALASGAGGGHLTADPMTPADDAEALPDLPYRVYYPEGYANDRASTFLPIVNGNAEAVRVVVIARYEGTAAFDVLYDSSTDTAEGSIAASKRDGITLTTPALYAQGTSDRVLSQIVNATTSVRREGVRKNTPYAVEVRASAPVGAILSHYDFGISTGDSFTSTLSDDWLLGEGSKGAGINDFVVFYNPNPGEVKVDLIAYPSGGGSPVRVSQTVAGHRRGGWAINDIAGIPSGAVSFRLDAEAPISVALTHFDSNTNSGFGTIAADGLGSTTGATSEGQLGVGAGSETIAVVNPNTTAADLNFTFSFANGSSFRHQVSIPAQRRGGFDVSSLIGFPRGQSYGVTYTSSLPVGVNITSRTNGEAAGSVLANRASTQWLFAEGFRPIAGDAVSEYLRLYNPSALPTTVEIVMNYNNGESEVFRRTLPPRAGVNLNIFDLVTGTRRTEGTVPGVGSFYGIKVQAAIPIIAFAGHFDDFLGGGFGTLGTPLGSTGLTA